MVYEPKTRPTDAEVEAFIDAVPSERKRTDSWELLKLMEDATGEPATLWGASIVGFGSYHYQYESGHAGDAPIVGFSPRKAAISIYVLNGFEGESDLLDRLGTHTMGKSCIYVKRLQDIDVSVLRELVERSLRETKRRWPSSPT
ncbi:MAG: DUF1801 domain-containing protein [Thermomicrobiales bacterium]